MRTYDIGQAIAERNRLEAAEQKRKEYEAERTKAKAEQEARRKAEAQAVMAAGKKQEEKTAEPESQQTAVPVPAVEIVEESIHVLDFRVYALLFSWQIKTVSKNQRHPVRAGTKAVRGG